jgi:hypothetical protein
VTNKGGRSIVCDPVLTTVLNGPSAGTTLTNVPRAEHVVTVENGSPGFSSFSAQVNGKTFTVNLADGQKQSIDVRSAIGNAGTYNLTLSGRGPGNASADVTVWDGIGAT